MSLEEFLGFMSNVKRDGGYDFVRVSGAATYDRTGRADGGECVVVEAGSCLRVEYRGFGDTLEEAVANFVKIEGQPEL